MRDGMAFDPVSETTNDQAAGSPWVGIIARNFSATMFCSALDSALRFFAYGYLARQLGPEVFGINSFMYATTLFFGSLSDFGLRILGAREIASRRAETEELVGRILSLKLVFVIAAYVLMQVFVFLTRDSAEVRWLGLIYGVSLLGFNTVDWVLMGLEQMHYLGMSRIINGVGVFVLVLTLVHGPEDLLLVGGIESLTFLLAEGYLLSVALRRVRIRLSFEFGEWRTLLREALPLGVSIMMMRFGNTLPVLALGLLSSDYQVGVYKAVGLLPSFLEHSNMILGDALLPTLSRIYAESARRFAAILSWVQKHLAVGGILLSALTGLVVGPFLPRVLGEEFRAGLGTFQVLMVVSAVAFSNLVLRKLLSACRAQREYAVVMTARTGALLLLSLFLARRGSVGEAWAVVLAECCALVLSTYFFQRLFPASRLHRALLKVAFSAGLAALVVWLLRGGLSIAVAAGVVVYGLMLLLLRVVSLSDLEHLKLGRWGLRPR